MAHSFINYILILLNYNSLMKVIFKVQAVGNQLGNIKLNTTF